jgi:hypothetical protein
VAVSNSEPWNDTENAVGKTSQIQYNANTVKPYKHRQTDNALRSFGKQFDENSGQFHFQSPLKLQRLQVDTADPAAAVCRSLSSPLHSLSSLSSLSANESDTASSPVAKGILVFPITDGASKHGTGNDNGDGSDADVFSKLDRTGTTSMRKTYRSGEKSRRRRGAHKHVQFEGDVAKEGHSGVDSGKEEDDEDDEEEAFFDIIAEADRLMLSAEQSPFQVDYSRLVLNSTAEGVALTSRDRPAVVVDQRVTDAASKTCREEKSELAVANSSSFEVHCDVIELSVHSTLDCDSDEDDEDEESASALTLPSFSENTLNNKAANTFTDLDDAGEEVFHTIDSEQVTGVTEATARGEVGGEKKGSEEDEEEELEQSFGDETAPGATSLVASARDCSPLDRAVGSTSEESTITVDSYVMVELPQEEGVGDDEDSSEEDRGEEDSGEEDSGEEDSRGDERVAASPSEKCSEPLLHPPPPPAEGTSHTLCSSAAQRHASAAPPAALHGDSYLGHVVEIMLSLAVMDPLSSELIVEEEEEEEGGKREQLEQDDQVSGVLRQGKGRRRGRGDWFLSAFRYLSRAWRGFC